MAGQLRNTLPIKSYCDVDVAIGTTVPMLNGRKIDARINTSNLFDDHGLTNVTGTTAAGAGVILHQPRPQRLLHRVRVAVEKGVERRRPTPC